MNRLAVLERVRQAALLCASAVCAVVPAACSATSTSSAPPKVPIVAVQRASVQQLISSTGEVRAPAQIAVQPQATGRVQQVLVDLGSTVRAGDVLARLESDSAQIGVLQARANMAVARARLQTV